MRTVREIPCSTHGAVNPLFGPGPAALMHGAPLDTRKLQREGGGDVFPSPADYRVWGSVISSSSGKLFWYIYSLKEHINVMWSMGHS